MKSFRMIKQDRIFCRIGVVCLLTLLLSFGSVLTACAQENAEVYYPEEPNPFMGNWAGRWSDEETVDPVITAQVISLGNDEYSIRLAPQLFMRARPMATIQVQAVDGVIRFDEAGYTGEIRGDSFTGTRHSDGEPYEMTRVVHVPPTLGAAPPENAIVLFDGSDFSAWTDASGWVITEDGAMMVTPDGKNIHTNQKFTDVQLHIEFRTPYQPHFSGQSRGNSGVFVHDEYEVQVLDSYGLPGYYDECGALYKVSAPYVNACLPPTQWQTYDITYHAPRFNDDGSVKTYPRMTVYHNGFVIQKEQEMRWITAWREGDRLQPPPSEPGSIVLQSHGGYYVQFRNVWIVEMDYNE